MGGWNAMTKVRQVTGAAAITAVAGVVSGAAVLAAEALAARNRRYATPDLQLAVRSSIGPAKAPALHLVLLGDSTALGVGVDQVSDTVGGQLAALLVDGPGRRRVELSSVAFSGARSADLPIQVARALVRVRPDIAVILIGSNDAIHLAPPAEAAAFLGEAVQRLRQTGVAVVVGTCPDLGAARAFAPPLRQLLGWHGRRIGRAQAEAVRAAGGIAVNLAERAGPVFRADAGTLCHDGFHPSADGYRVWAHALFPAIMEAAAADADQR
jgi:lysophospholipase L1-like esterase